MYDIKNAVVAALLKLMSQNIYDLMFLFTNQILLNSRTRKYEGNYIAYMYVLVNDDMHKINTISLSKI